MDRTSRQMTKIAREVRRFTARSLRTEGMGTGEMDVIHAIRKNPGTTQAAICDHLGIDKAAVTRQVASLEAKGYIVRRKNPGDGRSRILFATEKAEGLKRSKADTEARFYEWLLEDLPEDEAAAFARTLDTLYRKCKAESKADFPAMTARLQAADGENQ